jgi:hypothetical protein
MLRANLLPCYAMRTSSLRAHGVHLRRNRVYATSAAKVRARSIHILRSHLLWGSGMLTFIGFSLHESEKGARLD